ncbi:MAG TPA: metabolite traffic protein EboE [Cellvibrionaceae bacterium]
MAPLTYCSNIYPGESWADVMHNLDSHLLDVKSELKSSTPFPLGLRIAGQAALEADDKAIEQFQQWCHRHNCYLLTIKGFPYGAFHNSRVKEQVYLPDWRNSERVTYSKRLGDLAIRLQPDAQRISISTVPIAFKPGFADTDWPRVCQHICEVAEHYYQLQQNTGIQLVLSIEPEPYCVLETTDETIAFFQRLSLPEHLQPFVGLCFDACHQAVEYEHPTECLARIKVEGIPIGKVQVSSALRAQRDEIQHLFTFDEPVYLHQAVARCSNSGQLLRYSDLPELKQALTQGKSFDECRVHFHVPIFLEHLGQVGTTQFFLRELLPLLDTNIPLEVETYSFNAIAEHLRTDSMAKSIARELQWVEKLLA